MRVTSLKPRGFTLGELSAVLLIISLTAAILFPVVTNCSLNKERVQHNQCMSNLKQIGLAALTYAQDNDETLPPVYIEVSASGHTFDLWMRLWLGKNQVVALDRTPVFSLEEGSLLPYFKEESFAHCPVPTVSGSFATYLTNDLCGGMKPNTFASAAKTVMATDGDGMFPVTGHSLDDPRKRFQRWNLNTGQFLSGSVSVEGITRHFGGASYLFADGHVKRLTPEAVFFPPRESMSGAHRDPQSVEAIGPNPGGDMTLNGRTYTATFHLR